MSWFLAPARNPLDARRPPARAWASPPARCWARPMSATASSAACERPCAATSTLLPQGCDLILHPRRSVLTLEFAKLEAEIVRILQQAKPMRPRDGSDPAVPFRRAIPVRPSPLYDAHCCSPLSLFYRRWLSPAFMRSVPEAAATSPRARSMPRSPSPRMAGCGGRAGALEAAALPSVRPRRPGPGAARSHSTTFSPRTVTIEKRRFENLPFSACSQA
jgi:hypothetical protein